MELCYRGVRYEHQPAQFDISQTGELVKFRGQTYKPNKVALNINEQEKEGLVYRGIASCEQKQTKFLGQVYDRKSCYINLAVANKKTRFLGQICQNNSATLAAVNVTV